MPFVKLDTGILDSTLWIEREQREIFITALLMAIPKQLEESTQQIEVDSLERTGFAVGPGWYGFVEAAGIGIIGRARVGRSEGMKALKSLGSPDKESRSDDFEGRRLIRIDGGFLVLNYMKYRDRDYGAAERMRRLRARRNGNELHRNGVTVPRNVTQAEAEAEADKNNTKSKSGKSAHFVRPTLAEVEVYIAERKSPIDAQGFLDFYESKGWRIGNQAMKDWKAAVRTWERRDGWKPPKEKPPVKPIDRTTNICKTCKNTGLVDRPFHPGQQLYCNCPVGAEEKRLDHSR
jgi:hypothetical protein